MTTRRKKAAEAERAARKQRAEQAHRAQKAQQAQKQAQQAAEKAAKQAQQAAKKAQRAARPRPEPPQPDPRRKTAAGRQRPSGQPQNPQQNRPPQRPGGPQNPQTAQRPPRAAAAQEAAQRSRNKKEHMRITKAEMRRRRIRRRILAVCCLVFAVTAVVLLSVTMLFRVDRFEFQNMEGKVGTDLGGYTQAEILQTLAVKEGDNLFSFSPEEQEQLLNSQFPLLENVEVLRRMPSTVILRMQPAVPAFTIQTSAGWLVLSRQCKVMSMAGVQPDLPLLIGPVQTVPQVGETLTLGVAAPPTATPPLGSAQPQPPVESSSPTDPPKEHVALADMLTMLDQYEILDAVTHLDITDPEQVYFGYEDRIRVTLGTLNRLDYKVKFAVHLLCNKEGNGLAETDRGILDMSIIRADGTLRPTFKQCDPELPPRQPVDPPPEPEDPSQQMDTPADGTPPDLPAQPETEAAGEPTAAPTAEPDASAPTGEPAAPTAGPSDTPQP